MAQFVGCILLGGAVGYFIASLRADAERQQVQRAFAEREDKLETRYQTVQARERALMARREVHRALVALEQRNFGTTERLAREAGEILSGQGEAFAALSQTLVSFRPTVSDDISAQRQALLDIVQQLDKLIDAMPLP